jgi:hypothetical protein
MPSFRTVVALAAGVMLAVIVLAARGDAQMPMRGGMGDPSHQADMQVFHDLLEHRAKITRTVTNLPNGIDTLTLSDDPVVAGKLRGHVASMTKRMEENRPIHLRDPFFAEMFRQAKHVTIKVEPVPTGVRVIETSDDPYTVTLLQEHARIIELFLKNGMAEMHKNHEVPRRP